MGHDGAPDHPRLSNANQNFFMSHISSNSNQEIMQQQVLKESNLKVLQLEHDLKLKEMKMQIHEMQSRSQIDDLRNKIMQLELSVSKLSKDKLDLLSQKDDQIRRSKLELRQLEQELIDAKIESAYLKSRLQEK